MEKNNRINIDPAIWGQHFWMTIHSAALSYPKNPTDLDRKYFKNFYYSMRITIPCEKCRVGFTQHISNNPIDKHLKNTKTLFEWTISMHNLTNKSLDKPFVTATEIKKKCLGL